MLNFFSPKGTNPDDPLTRIVNTILGYAIMDGAREVRIEAQTENICVYFLLTKSETVHEQMKMPLYMLEPLVLRFREIAKDDNSFPLQLQDQTLGLGLDYTISVLAEDGEHGEKVTLAFKGHVHGQQ